MVSVGGGGSCHQCGRYLISASLEKESGYGIGLFDRMVDLAEGNYIVLVEFNARNFYGLDDGTRLFFRDLAITREDEVIDEIPEAWSSGGMNFGG
jgi:hypothetical protein